MKLLLIDNYDSFTWNLVELAQQAGCQDITIQKNDHIDPGEVSGFDKVLVSPGPGLPLEAGRTLELIRHWCENISLLGICLGHQALAQAFGGNLYHLDNVFHGATAEVIVQDRNEMLYAGLPERFTAGLYHSWAVDAGSLPDDLVITSLSTEGVLMGIRHKIHDIRGIQFHPESILTPLGLKMMKNWLYSPEKV